MSKNTMLVATGIFCLLALIKSTQTTQSILPLDQLSFLFLVCIPFITMVNAGLSRTSASKTLTTLFGLALIIVSILLLLPKFSASTNPTVGLIVTATIWLCLGIYAGLSMGSYLRTVRWTGFVFTFGVTLTAVSLSQMLIEVIDFVKAGLPIELGIIAEDYAALLVIGVSLLLLFGRQVGKRAVKIAVKKGLFTFTFVGILSFVLQQFAGEFLPNLGWWVPNTGQPYSYLVFFNVVLAIFAAFPIYEESEAALGKQVSFDERTGLEIAGDREESRNNSLQLTLTPFTYEIPKGWYEVRKTLEATQHVVIFQPPAGGIRRRFSSLRLQVYEYVEGTITNQEQLKLETYKNLKRQDAMIVESTDKIHTRHGVASHECQFKWGASYGYVIHFIFKSNEFVIIWTSISSETFRNYFPDVDEFVESLRFAT